MAFAGLAKGPPAAAGPSSSSSHAGWARDERPATAPASGDDAKAAFARVEDSRHKLLELEQLVFKAQGSVRAVHAREEAVRRDCGEQERRLRHLDREHASAREDFQAEHLEPLQRAEAKASEHLRQEQAAEKEARSAVERMRGRILDLSGDCGSALLGSATDRGGSEPSKAHKLLHAALPAAHPARHASDLNDLLGMLEAERAEVQAMLLGLPAADRGRGDAPDALREEAAALRKEVAHAEAQAQRRRRRAEALRSEAAAATADARGDAEDALLEAATLRRETGLWRRQQAEWEKSQARMLQLTGDLQHQRDRGAQRQALVAKRLRELKRELPPEGGGERVLEGIRNENFALQRQIEGLQRERAELLRKKQGLVSFVNSRLSEIQATVDGTETPNGEPCGRDCYPPSP